MLGDKEFERWILCELTGYSPSTMAETDIVPEYRSIPIRHVDVHRRPLIVDDPGLSFVNETRLRFGVRELEAYAKQGGMLFAHDQQFVTLIKEHLHRDVIQFSFSAAGIFGILDSIRAKLLDRVHSIEESHRTGES